MGASAPGNTTVSRTVRIGTSSGVEGSASAGDLTSGSSTAMRYPQCNVCVRGKPSLGAFAVAAQDTQIVCQFSEVLQGILGLRRIHTSDEVQVEQIFPRLTAQGPGLKLNQAEIAKRERGQGTK